MKIYIKNLCILILFIGICYSAVAPSNAIYNEHTNILTVKFSGPISTENILLGRISITDGSESYTMTGGTITDSSDYTDSLNISLVYGTVIDQLEQTIFGSAQTVQIWGNTTSQVDAVESFDLANCSVIFENGTFLTSDSSYSESATLALQVIEEGNSSPFISSATYSATHNALQLVFSTEAQFDQIAEDRSIDGGPGDGALAPLIPNNDPGEDRNSNNVLDQEVNIIPFKIGFVDSIGNSASLEGIKYVTQTSDNDTLDINLTINDAKRLETTLDLGSLKLNVAESAFRDTLYNPFLSSSISVAYIQDSLPLVADSGAYDYAKNEFYIYFRDSENTDFDISPSPAPVWSKIKFYNSSDSVFLATGSVTASNNSIKIKEMSLDVLSKIESLIQYDESGNLIDSVYCSLDAYTVYDRSENGNVLASNIPIRFYEGSSSSTYASPKPDKDADSVFVYYDAIANQLSFKWDTKIGTFKGVDVPDDDEIDVDVDPYSNLDGIDLYWQDDTVDLKNGHVWRSSDKKTIYVELSETDEILIESNSNKNSLSFLLDYYAFASTKDNGTPAITGDSLAFVSYLSDSLGPSIDTIQYDLQTRSFKIKLDQPVSKTNFSVDRFSFENIDHADVFDGSTVSFPDSADTYSTEIIIGLSESGSQILDTMSVADKITFTMFIDSNAFSGLDGISNAIDTVVVDYGQNYWITSFEAFPTATAKRFCSIGYIGTQCDIMVDINYKDSIDIALLDMIGKSFEATTTFDSTFPQYNGMDISIASTVRSFTGNENDFDENGKVVFVFTDILDEYGQGRNDTKSSLFVHGYSTPDDTVTSNPYSNGGEIIYIDTKPLDITSSSNDKNILLHAIAHEYTKMCLQHNKPNEEPWILEAVAQLMQKKIFGNTVFFGEGTAPSTSTGNQLTYLSTGVNKLKGRTDQHNVYIFFTYLQEQLIEPDKESTLEWDIVNFICNTKKTGVASVDTALTAIGSTKDFADYFSDYGMACYLDLVNSEEKYNGIYSFESLDLVSAPSGKSASIISWNKAGNNPAPFMFKNIAPWSYNWIIMQGYIVDIENNIIFKSPDLNSTDTLIFNGYDGIKFKVKKLALKSGFLDVMTTDYEVEDFVVDTTMGYGKLAVTTDSLFTFKELGVDSLGNIDTTTGVQLLMLMVAKVDDAPAPPTSDFWVSNINSLPDFSELYGFQNKGAQNHIDLFIASQRAVYDSIGNESAIISFSTERDSGEITLNILHDDIPDFTSYYSSYELDSETDYTFVFEGTDASGNTFTPDTLVVSTVFYNTNNRSLLTAGRADINLEPGILANNQFLAGMLLPKKLVNDTPAGLLIVSEIILFGPQDKKMIRSSMVNIHSNQLSSDCRVYQYYNKQWHNIGGIIDQESISAYTNAFGRFVVLRGNTHLPESEQLIVPSDYALFPNYPNPFNPITTLSYSIPEQSNISIAIVDILGRTIWSQNRTNVNPGLHRIIWPGKNNVGNPVASGVYFVEMRANDFIAYQKILLMK